MVRRVHARNELTKEARYKVARQQFRPPNAKQQALVAAAIAPYEDYMFRDTPKIGFDSNGVAVRTAHHTLTYPQLWVLGGFPAYKETMDDPVNDIFNLDDAWLDSETVDAYVSICARYVNKIREEHRLSHSVSGVVCEERQQSGEHDIEMDNVLVESRLGDDEESVLSSVPDDFMEFFNSVQGDGKDETPRQHVIVITHEKFWPIIEAGVLAEEGTYHLLLKPELCPRRVTVAPQGISVPR